MTDSITKVLEHYSATGLTDRIKSALATITPETHALTVAQLAPLDQFHTRGILATSDLARALGLDRSTCTARCNTTSEVPAPIGGVCFSLPSPSCRGTRGSERGELRSGGWQAKACPPLMRR